MGNDHTLNKKSEDLCAQREAIDTSSEMKYVFPQSPWRKIKEETREFDQKRRQVKEKFLESLKLRKDLLEEIEIPRIRYIDIFLLGEAVSGKSSFFNTCATVLRDTRITLEPCSALMPPQDTLMTRPTQMAIGIVAEGHAYSMIDPSLAGKNISAISNHSERPFSGHCATIECTQNVFNICSSGVLSKEELFLQFAIKTQKRDFTWNGYIISDLYQMYHGENKGEGKDFTCFWEDEKTLQDKEPPSDKNCESKIEILEEENKQLDKEMNEILQQCILRLNGMHTKRPTQKRQKATI